MVYVLISSICSVANWSRRSFIVAMKSASSCRRASAFGHAVDDGAERGLEEAEDIINPDMRGCVDCRVPSSSVGRAYPGSAKSPKVDGFSFDIADCVSLPEYGRVADRPGVAASRPGKSRVLRSPTPCERKMPQDLRHVVAEREHRRRRRGRIAREIEQPIQDIDRAEGLLSMPHVSGHQPEGRPTVVGGRAPKIGPMLGIAHAVIEDVVAWIVLPFAVDRDEGPVIIGGRALFASGRASCRGSAAAMP